MSGAEALPNRRFRAKNGIMSATAGNLAALGLSLGTELDASNRAGFYSDLTPGSEKIGFVVNATETASLFEEELRISARITASLSGALDIQTTRSLPQYSVLAANSVGVGNFISVAADVGERSVALGSTVTIAGVGDSFTRNAAVGSDVQMTASIGGRNAIFGAAVGLGGSTQGMAVVGVNRTGIQGNNGVALVSGGSSSIRLERGILIGSAAGQVGNFGRTHVIAIGMDVTANGDAAVAIGRGANSSHDNSWALGRSASTTAADQFVVGSASHGLNVRVISDVDSTSALDGALVVSGGVGVGKTLRVGDTSGTNEGGLVVRRSGREGELFSVSRPGGGGYTFRAIGYSFNRSIWGVEHEGHSARMSGWDTYAGPRAAYGFSTGVGFYNGLSNSGLEIDSATGATRVFGGALKLTDGLEVEEGAPDATMGVVTTVGGTATVNTTAVTASSRILLTIQENDGGIHTAWVASRVSGTSFTLEMDGPGDRPVAWLIINPA